MNYKQLVLDITYGLYKLINHSDVILPKNKTIGILFVSSPRKNIPLGEFILREPFFRYLYNNNNKLVLVSDDFLGDELIKLDPLKKYFSKRIEINQISNYNFNLILNLQNYPFSNVDYRLLKSHTKQLYSIGDKTLLFTPKIWKYVNYFPKPYTGSRHELQRAFDIFGIACDFKSSRYIPRINYKKQKIEYDYAINLFDSNSTKSWNSNKLIDFILKHKNQKIILIGGNDAKNQEKQILKEIRIESAVGKQNINKLIDILSISKVIITPDTGTAHLAAAMGKKVIVGYGPTELGRWKPLGKEVTQIFNLKGCKDCRETRFCKIKTKECMDIKLNCD